MNRFEQAWTTGATLSLLAMATLLGGGCQKKSSEPERRGAESFLGDDETSAVTRLADAQRAAGAREDATLRSYHFSRGELNSLGREQLDLMFADVDDQGEYVVYLDLDEAQTHGPFFNERRDAVAAYLSGADGSSERSVSIVYGVNPNHTFLATAARPEAKADEGGGNIFEMIGAMMEGMSGGGGAGAPAGK